MTRLRLGKLLVICLTAPTHEQTLATGFFRNHMINGEGGRIPEENRVEYVMDMVETMGTVWLGLTLNCCRCHDHKYDPLTNEDYYQLFAFFNQTPVEGKGGSAQTPPTLATPSDEQQAQLDHFATRVATLDKEMAAVSKEHAEGMDDWQRRMRQRSSEDARWSVAGAPGDVRQRCSAAETFRPINSGVQQEYGHRRLHHRRTVQAAAGSRG